MNKKFLTAFLFGAAVLASTSTFVSCKDYDDEISDLQAQIDSANQLHATKSELAAAKSELTAAYQAADAELSAAIAALKTASEAADAELTQKLTDEVTRATAKEAVLEAKIAALEDADTQLQALIDQLEANKVDKTTFNETVAEIYAKIETCSQTCATNLANAVAALESADNELKAQITALGVELRDADKVLQGNIDALSETVQANYVILTTLKQDFETQKAACEAFQTKVNGEIADLVAADDKLAADLATAKTELEGKITEVNNALEAAKVALNAAIEAAKTELQNNINATKTELEGKIETAKTELSAEIAKKLDITTFNTYVQEMQATIADINEELVSLTSLIKTSLRSLVFIPDSYYWGVEATEINYLEYEAYAVTTASVYNADKVADMAGTKVRGHNHPYTSGSKTLSFAAKYHLNPSSANLDGAKYALVTADKPYVRTASEADALLSIVGTPTASNGILNVNLTAAKPELIKSVPTNQAVTIFATQVTLPTTAAKSDTTVTSGYATLYRSNIKGLVMAYAKEPAYENEHCGPCEYFKTNSGETFFEGMHLFATQEELIAECADKGLYTCAYNTTLDLSKLIETHYTDENGTHMLMTADKMAATGLQYKFELVGQTFGSNETSQSVHAAINPTDGVTFRPQEADLKVADGEKVYYQKAYGAAQSRESIGRMPVVRVSLVDAEDGTVYDYGYLAIKIVETPNPEDENKVATIEYDGADINYYYTCETADFTLEKYWNNIEYDVLKTLMEDYSMKEEEFQTVYANEGHLVTSGDRVAQFEYVNGEWQEKTTYIGEVIDRYDAGDSQTSTLKWTVEGDYFVQNYYGKAAGKYSGLQTAVKYESTLPTIYPDIYIILSSGDIYVYVPSGVAFVNSNKIAEYWYKVDGNSAADGATVTGEYKEIHAQTISPEDAQAHSTADVLDDTFSDVFVGNKITLASVDNLGGKNNDWDLGTTKSILGLYFSDENNDKEYAALDGTKVCYYTLKVADGGYALQAVKKNGVAITPETIATITTLVPGSITIDEQVIALNKESEIAKALLNYAAHNNLDAVSADGKKVLKAIIMMKATNACGHELALTDKTFDVRFLRPINVFGNNKELEDAQDAAQTIELRDLVRLTDWRDYEFADHLNYWNYYNIKSIKVINANNDGNINAYITTTMNNSNYAKTQAEVSNNVLFKVYYATPADKSTDSYGYIEYQNLSSAVQTFSVNIPLLVEYEWGYVTTSVNVTVKNTHANAKKF